MHQSSKHQSQTHLVKSQYTVTLVLISPDSGKRSPSVTTKHLPTEICMNTINHSGWPNLICGLNSEKPSCFGFLEGFFLFVLSRFLFSFFVYCVLASFFDKWIPLICDCRKGKESITMFAPKKNNLVLFLGQNAIISTSLWKLCHREVRKRRLLNNTRFSFL